MKKALCLVLVISLLRTTVQAIELTLFTQQTSQLPSRLIPPARLGRITDSFTSSEKGPLVVLIQDLHAHYGVQKNIAGLLEFLSRKGIHFSVAVEGAEGPIDSSVMALFPDQKIKQEACDYLMRQGELTGMEYFAAMHGMPHLLIGVENERYYSMHRDLFRKTLTDRTILVNELTAIQDDLLSLRATLYSSELKSFQKRIDAYSAGTLSVGDYLELLVDQARSFRVPLPNSIQSYLSHSDDAKSFEKIIFDFNVLQCQIKKAMASKETSNSSLVSLIQVEQDLDLLIRVVNVRATETEILAFGPQLNPFVALTKSLLALNGHSTFDEQKIRQLVGSSLNYYAMALARNKPMADHTIQMLDSSPHSVVLVAGGFHTSALTQLFRERHISYVVITPTVDKINDSDRELYIKRLRGEFLTKNEIESEAHRQITVHKNLMHVVQNRQFFDPSTHILAVGAFAAATTAFLIYVHAHGLSIHIAAGLTAAGMGFPNNLGKESDLPVDQGSELTDLEKEWILTKNLKRKDGKNVLLIPMGMEFDWHRRLDPDSENSINLELVGKRVLAVPGYSINGFLLAQQGAAEVDVYDADPVSIAWLKAVYCYFNYQPVPKQSTIGERFLKGEDISSLLVEAVKQNVDESQYRWEKRMHFKVGRVDQIPMNQPYDFVFVPGLLGFSNGINSLPEMVSTVRILFTHITMDGRILITPSRYYDLGGMVEGKAGTFVKLLQTTGYAIEEKLLGGDDYFVVIDKTHSALRQRDASLKEIGAPSVPRPEQVQPLIDLILRSEFVRHIVVAQLEGVPSGLLWRFSDDRMMRQIAAHSDSHATIKSFLQNAVVQFDKDRIAPVIEKLPPYVQPSYRQALNELDDVINEIRRQAEGSELTYDVKQSDDKDASDEPGSNLQELTFLLSGRWKQLRQFREDRRETKRLDKAGHLQAELMGTLEKPGRLENFVRFVQKRDLYANAFVDGDVKVQVRPMVEAPQRKNRFGAVVPTYDERGKIRALTFYLDERLSEGNQYRTAVHELVHELIRYHLEQDPPTNIFYRLFYWFFLKLYEEWRTVQAHELIMDDFYAKLAEKVPEVKASEDAAQRQSASLSDLSDEDFNSIVLLHSDPKQIANDTSVINSWKQRLISSAA